MSRFSGKQRKGAQRDFLANRAAPINQAVAERKAAQEAKQAELRAESTAHRQRAIDFAVSEAKRLSIAATPKRTVTRGPVLST